ncbi:MAG: LON peptidase substrate-binding domain-containing protein [Ignavibacteria bacterium]
MRFLPLFPLPLVVYPGETLNLHIFEPRYKELIGVCLAGQSSFGMPTFMNEYISLYGTEASILELVKKYKNGEMDITVKGGKIFKTINFHKKVSGKLYSGADVEIITDKDTTKPDQKKEVLEKMEELFRFAGIEKKIKVNPEQHLSFIIAHTLGLSLEQEYELLTIKSEEKRLKFIIDHLTKILPIVSEFEKLKEKIKMNGHFRNYPKIKY